MSKKITLLALSCLLIISSIAQDAHRGSIVLSDDASLFACNYDNDAIEVYATATGKKVYEQKGSRKSETYSMDMMSLTISPDNKYLAIAPGGNTTRIIDIETGKQVATVELGTTAVFTSTGKLVTITDKTMNTYSAHTFAKERTTTLPDLVNGDAKPCTLNATSDKIVVPLFYSE